MNEKEYLEAIDLLYKKYGKCESEADWSNFRDRLAWLVLEYKQGSNAGWWKDDLDE